MLFRSVISVLPSMMDGLVGVTRLSDWTLGALRDSTYFLGGIFNKLATWLGGGAYDAYGAIAIEPEDIEMLPNSVNSNHANSAEYEGEIKPGQVNLYYTTKQTATLTYVPKDGTIDDALTLEWEASHSDLKVEKLHIPKSLPKAKITAENGPRMVQVYVKISGKRASSDAYVPTIKYSNEGYFAAAKPSTYGKYYYERPSTSSKKLLVGKQLLQVLGEAKGGLTNYYYVRLPNGNNRFVKKNDVVLNVNPILSSSPKGPYLTAGAAALDWANHVYSASVYIRHEFGATIYKKNDGLFYITAPVSGDPDSTFTNRGGVPAHQRVAEIHTHPGDINMFSNADLDLANKYEIDSYLVASALHEDGFHVTKYTFSTKTVEPTPIGTVTMRSISATDRSTLESTYYDSWWGHFDAQGICKNNCQELSWPASPWPW